MNDRALRFSTQDLSFTEDGRITIQNPELARALMGYIRRLSPDTVGIFDNCDCKGGSLRSVHVSDVISRHVFRFDSDEAGIFDNCDCGKMEITTDDLVLGEDGTITIENPEFAKTVAGQIRAVFPDSAGIFDNCDCKKRDMATPVSARTLPHHALRFTHDLVGIFDNCDCKSRRAQMRKIDRL